MIVVSACLIGENCKYNGGNNRSEKLVSYLQDKAYLAVCPEVMGGLSVPRAAAEISGGRVLTQACEDVTEAFEDGARQAVKVIPADVSLVILQSRSPSCGLGMIYDGTFSKRLIPGDGIFVRLLKNHNIPCMDIRDWEDA